MTYKLKLDLFEGPLDLLLYLIKKDEINIYDIPITQVTDQYMEYIGMMELLNLEMVGDFLVMAATLIQIKSRMLLPPDPMEEKAEEEDPRDELVKRLLEYKQFKEVAENLKEKESVRQDFFPRLMDEAVVAELKEDAKETYYEVSLFDLISAFTKAIRRVSEDVSYQITQEEFTVDQKVHVILHRLMDQERVGLSDLLADSKSKVEIIVTFIAVLELIRLKEILVVQQHHFEEIELLRNKENLAPKEDSNE